HRQRTCCHDVGGRNLGGHRRGAALLYRYRGTFRGLQFSHHRAGDRTPARDRKVVAGSARPHVRAWLEICRQVTGGETDMNKFKLSGVIAAVATACDGAGEPDCTRSAVPARFLPDQGCDGLNVLATTGEATSYALNQRQAVMNASRTAGLPLDRMMVGSGAAAIADAVALTRHAAELGFGGALVLPPFYYKGVPDDGLASYVAAIVKATADRPIPLYLYHYPQLSGVPWHPKLIRRLLAAHGDRI